MLSFLHPDPDNYGVTKPVIFWQQQVAVLTPCPDGPILFGGPLPKGGNLGGAILHSIFSIPICSIPGFKDLVIETLPLIYPFRHDGGSAEYSVTRDGSVNGLEVEPPQPEDEWPYPDYPQEFDIARYACSEFEPLGEEDSLRLLHQGVHFHADRDIVVIIPSKSNDPTLPVNLWNHPDDEECVQCVFIFNTETNEVAAFNDVD